MSNVPDDSTDSAMLNIQPLRQDLIRQIDEIDTFELAETFSNYLMFYYGHIIKNQQPKQNENDATNKNHRESKNPSYRTFYALCEEGKITRLTRYFGITPTKLAENMQESFNVHDIEQHNKELSAMAEEYISSKFPSTEKVILTNAYIGWARHLGPIQVFRVKAGIYKEKVDSVLCHCQV